MTHYSEFHVYSSLTFACLACRRSNIIRKNIFCRCTARSLEQTASCLPAGRWKRKHAKWALDVCLSVWLNIPFCLYTSPGRNFLQLFFNFLRARFAWRAIASQHWLYTNVYIAMLRWSLCWLMRLHADGPTRTRSALPPLTLARLGQSRDQSDEAYTVEHTSSSLTRTPFQALSATATDPRLAWCRFGAHFTLAHPLTSSSRVLGLSFDIRAICVCKSACPVCDRCVW